MALDVETGRPVWTLVPDDEDPFDVDGPVEIGAFGEGLRVWVPSGTDLLVSRNGKLQATLRGPLDALPPGMTLFPVSKPDAYQFVVQQAYELTADSKTFQGVEPPQKVEAHLADGSIAFRVENRDPMFEYKPAIAVPGGFVMVFSSGDVVCFEYLAS